MSRLISQRSMSIALPVLAVIVCGSLFAPWMRAGFGDMTVTFTPITHSTSSVGAWILLITLVLGTAISFIREWVIALVGWVAASVAGFAVLNWLVIQRFSSLLSIRIVKTEFGSVIQPSLVIAMVSSLLLVAVVVFDALGDVSTSPLLQLTGGIRVAMALFGSVAILLARDLPFVYARVGSATWAIGGGSIPAVGEILGLAALICASCLIIGLFVSHTGVERAVFVSAVIFGVVALIAALLDSILISIISSMIGRLSGRPDGKAVIESALGAWACVVVAGLIAVSSLYVGRLGRVSDLTENPTSTPFGDGLPRI